MAAFLCLSSASFDYPRWFIVCYLFILLFRHQNQNDWFWRNINAHTHTLLWETHLDLLGKATVQLLTAGIELVFIQHTLTKYTPDAKGNSPWKSCFGAEEPPVRSSAFMGLSLLLNAWPVLLEADTSDTQPPSPLSNVKIFWCAKPFVNI